jgi:hypothetical protein
MQISKLIKLTILVGSSIKFYIILVLCPVIIIELNYSTFKMCMPNMFPPEILLLTSIYISEYFLKPIFKQVVINVHLRHMRP